jgi:hypothetical protein
MNADHWSRVKLTSGHQCDRFDRIRPLLQSVRWKQKSLVPEGEAQSADILIPDAGVLMVKAGRSLALRQLFDRLNHDELTHRAAIHKLDFAGDLGEQSVIFAPADI